MIQEEKELLLKDLCARLPYGLKGKCEIDASYDTSFDTIFQIHKFDAILEGIKECLLFVTPLIEDKDEQEFANEEVADGIDILDFKPYLRPMSSMTEEEEKEYFEIIGYKGEDENGWIRCDNVYTEWGLNLNGCNKLISWLDKNHFDHRTDEEGKTLIEKGLAIPVTEENNPYKE